MINLNEDLIKYLDEVSFSPYLEEMRRYAKENQVPIIMDDGLKFLVHLTKKVNPKKILEIGTAIGYSASLMALNSDATIYTIERDQKMEECAIKNINELGLNEKVNLIFKDALLAFDDVKEHKFDIIFIDAAKAQYTNFFNMYSPLLSDNGIIITDNMSFHGVTIDEAKTRALRGLIRKLNNYREFLLSHENFDTKIYEIGDGMAVSLKKHK